MYITKQCPMCGKIMALKLSEKEYENYQNTSIGLIQDRLPKLGIVEREFLISGYCYSCQSLLFGNNFQPKREKWVEV